MTDLASTKIFFFSKLNDFNLINYFFKVVKHVEFP